MVLKLKEVTAWESTYIVKGLTYTQAKYEFENQGLKGELAGIPKFNVEFEWGIIKMASTLN